VGLLRKGRLNAWFSRRSSLPPGNVALIIVCRVRLLLPGIPDARVCAALFRLRLQSPCWVLCGLLSFVMRHLRHGYYVTAWTIEDPGTSRLLPIALAG